jgi:hypothetical protein
MASRQSKTPRLLVASRNGRTRTRSTHLPPHTPRPAILIPRRITQRRPWHQGNCASRLETDSTASDIISATSTGSIVNVESRAARCVSAVQFRLIAVPRPVPKTKIRSVLSEVSLFANENQNARCQCQDSHYDCRDGDVEQQSDPGENQIDGQQEHSEVFGDVHGSVLRQRQSFCTLKITRCKVIYGFLLTTFTAGLLIRTSALTF